MSGRSFLECCGIPNEVLHYFQGDYFMFILKNKRHIKIVKKENDSLEFILKKPSIIRDYSKIIGKIGSNYKVKNGGLYLDLKQFSAYLGKKFTH